MGSFGQGKVRVFGIQGLRVGGRERVKEVFNLFEVLDGQVMREDLVH